VVVPASTLLIAHVLGDPAPTSADELDIFRLDLRWIRRLRFLSFLTYYRDKDLGPVAHTSVRRELNASLLDCAGESFHRDLLHFLYSEF